MDAPAIELKRMLKCFRFKTEVELESQYGQFWHTDLGLWGKFDFFGKPLYDEFGSPLYDYEIKIPPPPSHPMERYEHPSMYATIKGEQHYINFLICEKDKSEILSDNIFNTYKDYSHILDKQ